MIQIRYVDIAPLADPQYQILYTRASEFRQQRAHRYLRQQDKYRCITADALLRYALRQCFGSDQSEIARTAGGKPYLPDREDFHFNLSHSGRWVVIAWGGSPVGIDVETLSIDEGKKMLAQRYFNPDEQSYLFAAQGQEWGRRFFEIWTKKESYLKFLGTGINRPLNSFSVLQPLEAEFRTQFLEDAVLTLCAGNPECQSVPLSLEALLSE